MPPTLVVGAAGSGKTSALQRCFLNWVQDGTRTDQVLVLTATAELARRWRQGLPLEAHGPVEAFGFYGFVQRELTLFWSPLQATVPPLRRYARPEFLEPGIAGQMVFALVEPALPRMQGLVAGPRRVAMELAGTLPAVSAAAGLTPADAADRMAAAGRPGPHAAVAALQEEYRERLLQGGFLDYGLALELFTTVLLNHPPYLAHLRRRYRCLLVDDLDETVPAEQDFLAALAGQLGRVAMSFGTDGGHRSHTGADPELALARFQPDAAVEELPGSHTCSPVAFRFGSALAARIMGDVAGESPPAPVSEQITTELRSEMVVHLSERVARLVAEGVDPREIAVITPQVDAALEVTLRRHLAGVGVQLQTLGGRRRILDDPHARTVVALCGLANSDWGILAGPDATGHVSLALQTLLAYDPYQAGDLAAEAIRGGCRLPESPLGGPYRHLERWVAAARSQPRPPDELAQAALAQVVVPLAGRLAPESLQACHQLLDVARRFRLLQERCGNDVFGWGYVPLLTEATLPLAPDESGPDPGAGGPPAVRLAAPRAFLARRLSAAVQVWADVSAEGWYPYDARELVNPELLSRRWPDGARWDDAHARRARAATAARIARGLLRRCRGQLILASSILSAWGQEQDGPLAEALNDLLFGGGA